MSGNVDHVGPATKAIALTPSDSTDLLTPTRFLYLGVAGDVAVTLFDDVAGTSVVLKGLAAGVLHALRVKRLWATGTAATNIVGAA